MTTPAPAVATTRTNKASAKAAGTAAPAANQAEPAPARQLYPLHPALPAHPTAIPVDAPTNGRSLSQPPAGPRPLRLQRKLAVGAANDPLELEADAMAEHVVRGPDPRPGFSSSQLPVLRRSCACGGLCDACQEEQETRLQRKAAGDLAPSEAPAIVHQVLSSSGQPMDAATRAYMEPRFRSNFGHVRIHDDPVAADSAKAVHASAYTVGSHICFAQGSFAPNSVAGKRLLAHELSHVVQQAGGLAAAPVHAARSAPIPLQRQESPDPFDTVAFIATHGIALKKSVEQTHWNSERERLAFIRRYLRYTRDHNLTAQYQEGLAAYPDALPAQQAPEAKPPVPDDSSKAAPAARKEPEASEWTLGPRGEHLPTRSWKGGPLRPIASYDKPWAQDLARAGNYEAAELAQNYLCASCHILTKVSPKEFDLNGYTLGWQANYIKGFVEVPLMASPLGGAWEIGVSGGQALTGEGSGLHIGNISNVIVYGHSDIGQKLTPGQRSLEGVNFIVGIALMGHAARTGGGVPTPKGPPESVVLVEGPPAPHLPVDQLPPPLPAALEEAAGTARNAKPQVSTPPRSPGVPDSSPPTVTAKSSPPPSPPPQAQAAPLKPVVPDSAPPTAAKPPAPPPRPPQAQIRPPKPPTPPTPPKALDPPVAKANVADPSTPKATPEPTDTAKPLASENAKPNGEAKTPQDAASTEKAPAPTLTKEQRLEQIRQERAANEGNAAELDKKISEADQRSNEAGEQGSKARGAERTRLQEKAQRNRDTANRLLEERRQLDARNQQLAAEAAKLDPPLLAKPTTWQEAEDVLRKEFGGQKKTLRAGELGERDIDSFSSDGISREAKFGPQGLSDRMRVEIAKDVALRNAGQVKGVEWHFYENVDGSIGPYQPLRDALDKAGIAVILHR